MELRQWFFNVLTGGARKAAPRKAAIKPIRVKQPILRQPGPVAW